jgi:hypothetical protein
VGLYEQKISDGLSKAEYIKGALERKKEAESVDSRPLSAGKKKGGKGKKKNKKVPVGL